MDPVRERVLNDVLAERERLAACPMSNEALAGDLPLTASSHLRRLWVEAAARTIAAIEALDRVNSADSPVNGNAGMGAPLARGCDPNAKRQALGLRVHRACRFAFGAWSIRVWRTAASPSPPVSQSVPVRKIKPEQHPSDRDWITVVLATAGLLILVGLMVALVAWGATR